MSVSRDDFMTESDRVALEGKAPRAKDRKVERDQVTAVPHVYSWTPPVQPAAQAPPTAAPQPETEATKKGISLPKVDLDSETLSPIACLSIAVFMLISYLLGWVSGGTAFGVGAFMCAGLVSILGGNERPLDVANAIINALAFYGICNLLPNWPVPVVSWLCISTLFCGALVRRGSENPMGFVVLAWWFVAIGLFIASLCSWN